MALHARRHLRYRLLRRHHHMPAELSCLHMWRRSCRRVLRAVPEPPLRPPERQGHRRETLGMAAMLEGYVDKVVQVITNDGRNIVGLLKRVTDKEIQMSATDVISPTRVRVRKINGKRLHSPQLARNNVMLEQPTLRE